jgi:hypothetical protein
MSMYSDLRRQTDASKCGRSLAETAAGEARIGSFVEYHRGPVGLDTPVESGSVEFQVADLSPYVLPLDGKFYDVDPLSGPRGTCPLCNNVQARGLDAWYMRRLGGRGKWREKGFPEAMVLDHLVNHVGMVYAGVLDGMEEFRKLDKGKKLDLRGLPELEALVRRVSSALTGEEHRRSRHAGMDHDADTQVIFSPPPLARIPGGGHVLPDPAPAVVGRPAGARAKKWYAWDGQECIGQMRPWEEGRVKDEICSRAGDAIVFYDEMLDVRHRARRVYDEIMDSDPGEGMARNYSAAVAAVREIKGVAMDMAKLALIATKYGDEGDRVRQISPSMKAMLDDIGIFQSKGSADAVKMAEIDGIDEIDE